MNSNSLKILLDIYLNKTDKYTLNDFILIASKVLEKDKNDIFFNLDNIILDDKEYNMIFNSLNDIVVNNIPFQYVLGYKDFYNERYFVNESVLIPREDTEILVEKACYIINKYNLKTMVDMCTGSGCIGISTAKNSNILKVDMVDISKGALDVARKNIIFNNVLEKCNLIESDLFKNIESKKKYDILVSNPPYIKTDIILTLSEDVKREPILALDGGKDGLDMYRKIFYQCKNFLNDNAFLLLEIGYDQREDLKELIKDINYLEYIDIIKDYGNNDRVVICRFHQI